MEDEGQKSTEGNMADCRVPRMCLNHRVTKHRRDFTLSWKCINKICPQVYVLCNWHYKTNVVLELDYHTDTKRK